MNKLIDMVSAADGSISLMRVCVFMVVAAFLFNWCYLTVKTGQAQPLDWDQVVLVLGALGAKALQRPFESKPTISTVAPETTTPKNP